ncbi:MAG: hypothetical protein ACOVO3_03770 [Fluviicola sp.]|jgi:hypothetical protein
MSETLDTNAGSGKRPGFLTVLCILTFIGSGLGVLGSILGLIGSSALGMFAPQGTMVVQLISLASAALCLFGAIKMWGLAKQGFMLYLMGGVLGIVGAIVSAITVKSYIEQSMTTISGMEGMEGMEAAVNDSAVALASAAAWTGVVITVIINGLFIVLYAVNRKHLTK